MSQPPQWGYLGLCQWCRFEQPSVMSILPILPIVLKHWTLTENSLWLLLKPSRVERVVPRRNFQIDIQFSVAVLDQAKCADYTYLVIHFFSLSKWRCIEFIMRGCQERFSGQNKMKKWCRPREWRDTLDFHPPVLHTTMILNHHSSYWPHHDVGSKFNCSQWVLMSEHAWDWVKGRLAQGWNMETKLQ